jgi:TnpA family transposase
MCIFFQENKKDYEENKKDYISLKSLFFDDIKEDNSLLGKKIKKSSKKKPIKKSSKTQIKLNTSSFVIELK